MGFFWLMGSILPKRVFEGKMELIGQLSSNETSNIRIISSASNSYSIKFAEQCLHILTNNERLNIIKGSKKIQKGESSFKYQ